MGKTGSKSDTVTEQDRHSFVDNEAARRADFLSDLRRVKRRLSVPQTQDTSPTFRSLLRELFLPPGQPHTHRSTTVLLLGPTGAGKSTLANTIAGKHLFQPRKGVREDTPGSIRYIEEHSVDVLIDGALWDLTLQECYGFDGNPEHDQALLGELESLRVAPDLVILCCDISALACRHLASYDCMVQQLKSCHGGQYLSNLALAFTKVNLLQRIWRSETDVNDAIAKTCRSAGDVTTQAVQACKGMWTEILERTAGVSTHEVPIGVFGRMVFSARHQCNGKQNITPIEPWGTNWLNESLREVVNVHGYRRLASFVHSWEVLERKSAGRVTLGMDQILPNEDISKALQDAEQELERTEQVGPEDGQRRLRESEEKREHSFRRP